MAKGAPGLARGKVMAALAVERLRESAFVGGAPGLQLLISPGGARTWRLFYRLPGALQRRAMTLGRFPEVSLSDARRRAGEALALAADGVDPKTARAKKAKRSALTVVAALDAYLAACANLNDPHTLRDKRSAFDNHVRPAHGARSLPTVTRAEWLAVLDGLAARPGIRRNLYAYLHHFLGWANERDMIDANPLLGVRAPKPVVARDRVLSDEEIRGLWACEGETATLARLALLTAQRQGSLAAMRWDYLDLKAGLWRIPSESMKSGAAHEAPLSAMAVALLSNRPRLGGPYVFGIGTAGAKPFQGFSNGMEALRVVMPPASMPWRFHDLRRTAVTLAQRAGCPLDAIRALTQHKTPGVIGVYARHAYSDEKRQVAAAIEAVVEDILKHAVPTA